jgi:hypothetical protein
MATQPPAQPAQPTWQMSSPPPAQPMTPEQNPMAVHVKVIAILEIVWGVLAAIGAFALLMLFTVGSAVTKGAGAPDFVPGIIASLGLFLVVLVGALAVVALIGGTRLLRFRRSGKVPTYIAAALSLVSFPLGTAFGIYTFIILSNEKTDQLLVNP